MGSILKSTVAIKICKRHRREGQGEDSSAAMRRYVGTLGGGRTTGGGPSQARGVVVRRDPHAIAKTVLYVAL